MYSPILFKSLHRKSVWILLFCFLSLHTSVDAQIKKGEKLMSQGAYSEAIKPLKKDFYSENRNVNAGILLAKCYFNLRDYQEAIDVFSQIDPHEIANHDDRRFMADVHIVNDDYSGAYLELIQLLSEDQSDEKTYLWLDKVGDLMKWDSVPNNSTTDVVKGINTIYNEYAPFMASENELWFVSDVSGIQTVFPASYNNNNLHLYFKTKLKNKSTNEVSKPSMLFKKRDYYYHDGPLSRRNDGQYALTLRDIDSPSGNLGIFFSTLSGKQDDLEPFKYNQKFNTGHPTFAKSGNRMIFSSDRPGGYGQMDLWYSDFINNDWTEPMNMGPIINTPYNEVFPTHYKGSLFYSSDRQDIGYGALDIYKTSEQEGYNKVTNLRAPINGPYDDFGTGLVNTLEGYYSSNRKAGFGGDDIYAFSYRPDKISIKQTNFEFVAGDIPEGALVQILNGNDSLIATATTTANNSFQVENLETGENYKIKLVDGTISNDVRVKIITETGRELNEFAQSGNQEIGFELTGADEIGSSLYVSETKKMAHAIMGKLIAEKGIKINDIPVSLRSIGGSVLAESTTDSVGKFTMADVVIGEQYTIETDGLDAYHEIDIYGSSGAITQSLIPSGTNSFSYTRAAAPALWMETSPVAVDNVFAVVLDTETNAGEAVTLYDADDEVLATPTIDEDGFMKLGTMLTGNAYRLNLPSSSLSMDNRLVILDGNGDTSQTVRPFDANNYFFEYLIYKDYGQNQDDADAAALAKLQDKSQEKNASITKKLKAVIKDFDMQRNTAFILKSNDGTVQDTIYSNSAGVIFLGDIDLNKIYELVLLDGTFMKNKMVELFDSDNQLIFSLLSSDFKIFKLGMLSDLDFGLPKLADSSKDQYTVGLSVDPLGKKSGDVRGFRNGNLGKSYKASIADFDLPAQTPMLLKSLDGLRSDTIYSNSKGILIMDNLKENLEYELVLLDTTFAENKKIRLFNDAYKTVHQSTSVDNKKFRFSLLNADDKSLTALDNNNASVLRINLAGRIKSKDGVNAQITVFDTDNKELGSSYSTSDGNFVVEKITPMTTYTVTSTSEDPDAVLVIKIPDSSDSLHVKRNADGKFYVNMNAENKPELTLADNKQQVKVQEGARFSLPAVYYAFNSYYLKLEAKKSLEGLVNLMKDNPELRIEIQSHTDCRGPANYNNLLSQRRADGVADYLKSVGIKSASLTPVGKGEKELTNKCADGVNCDENEHAQNRRTEFLILGNETAEE